MTPDPIRHDIMPRSVARLPRDERGFPIPWFVAWENGVHDFRVMDTRKLENILRGDRSCWTCGGQLRSKSAYVIGPMCAINRISSEPTSHVECAEYAAQACPFLSNPRRVRKDHEHTPFDMPTREMAGKGILRNPGVALVWVIKGRAKWFKAPNEGHLFTIGTPVEAKWYAHGRDATRAEVDEAIASGMPTLMDAAPNAVARATLMAHASQARRFLPAA